MEWLSPGQPSNLTHLQISSSRHVVGIVQAPDLARYIKLGCLVEYLEDAAMVTTVGDKYEKNSPSRLLLLACE